MEIKPERRAEVTKEESSNLLSIFIICKCSRVQESRNNIMLTSPKK